MLDGIDAAPAVETGSGRKPRGRRRGGGGGGGSLLAATDSAGGVSEAVVPTATLAPTADSSVNGGMSVALAVLIFMFPQKLSTAGGREIEDKCATTEDSIC